MSCHHSEHSEGHRTRRNISPRWKFSPFFHDISMTKVAPGEEMARRRKELRLLKVKAWAFTVRLLLVLTMISLFVSFNLGKLVDESQARVIPSQKTASEKQSSEVEDYFTSFIDLPLIHVVNTRFMQEQGQLQHLSLARLHLFETFCLPTMIHQTIQPSTPNIEQVAINSYKFLWIIKIDPTLDANVLQRLIQVLRPYPNFFLVGSNNNFGVGVKPGSWRTGESGADILAVETPIYTGSLRLLEYAHNARESKIVVETRLDADDGLPIQYLENIQQSVWNEWAHPNSNVEGEVNNNNHNIQSSTKWMYWCVSEVINWYPTVFAKGINSTTTEEEPKVLRDPGKLVLNHEPICYTPGLSVAMPIGVMNLPKINHYNLLEKKINCGLSKFEKEKRCVNTVPMRAIRSRTVTSAGFKDLRDGAQQQQKTAMEDESSASANWKLLNTTYRISRENAYTTNVYLHENLLQILQDNWEGQCTSGHSCKRKAQDELKELIRRVGGFKAVDELPIKPLVFLRKMQKRK